MNPDQNKNPVEEKKEPLKTERVPIKSLRTFQGDVQEAISKNKYSSTTILVSEQKRQLERPEIADLKKKSEVKNKSYLLIGSVLILLGLVAIYLLLNMEKETSATVEEKQKTLITYSEEKNIPEINISRETLVQSIQEQKQSWGAPVNSVLYVNIGSVGKRSKISDISALFGPNMPPSLRRSFGEDYMLGIYSFDTNETFIILTIDDYSLAYPGMLKWEESIAKDLNGFFNINPDINSDQVFVDETVKNRDMRVLKDSNGKPLILYSFIDRETLVITKSESILSAIAGKLILKKQVR